MDEMGSHYEIYEGGKPVVAFLFKLISQLQFSGTVPMVDVQAYAKWLSRRLGQHNTSGIKNSKW